VDWEEAKKSVRQVWKGLPDLRVEIGEALRRYRTGSRHGPRDRHRAAVRGAGCQALIPGQLHRLRPGRRRADHQTGPASRGARPDAAALRQGTGPGRARRHVLAALTPGTSCPSRNRCRSGPDPDPGTGALQPAGTPDPGHQQMRRMTIMRAADDRPGKPQLRSYRKPLCVKGLGRSSSRLSSWPSVAVVSPRLQVVRPRFAAGAPLDLRLRRRRGLAAIEERRAVPRGGRCRI
jgi:hypothetical protein